jgi:hypothetical protein
MELKRALLVASLFFLFGKGPKLLAAEASYSIGETDVTVSQEHGATVSTPDITLNFGEGSYARTRKEGLFGQRTRTQIFNSEGRQVSEIVRRGCLDRTDVYW